MVITVLAATVDPDRESELITEYGHATGALPPFVLESFLTRDLDGSRWRIVTVWRSREDLDAYRRKVEVAEGVRIFRTVDAEPELTETEVLHRATR